MIDLIDLIMLQGGVSVRRDLGVRQHRGVRPVPRQRAGHPARGHGQPQGRQQGQEAGDEVLEVRFIKYFVD